MLIVETIIQLIIEIGRTALVEELSERVRRVQIRRIKGIEQVRRHIHRTTRRRLFDRLSTEHRAKQALS